MRHPIPLSSKIQLGIITFILLFLTANEAAAQYRMENLDRGVVAFSRGSDVYIGWRMFGTEAMSVSYNVYRDGNKINASPITNSTNYVDAGGSTASTYSVSAIVDGVEQPRSTPVSTWAQHYKEIGLNRPAGGTSPDGVTYVYEPNDATVADLDGDGEYEIIFKWAPTNSKDNAHEGYTGNTLIEAVKLNGTRLWRIDLGRNIRSGAHYVEMQAYDFDGDGKAEVALKTADATVDGQGKVIGDANADYRNSAGRVLSGPEFLTMFNGETGAAMSTVNYVPARGNVSDWGDNYGNRVDRFLSGIGYFDGQHPSLLMCRGYYTRMVLAAWDFVNGQLVQRWVFDTNNGYSGYRGKGNHQLSIADVDGDGKQEVVYGSAMIDDDGTPMYTNTWGHGDALHCGDLNLQNPGLEVFMPVEWASSDPANGRPGFVMKDAENGNIIWQEFRDGDIGRGNCANIDPNHPGAECWASSGAGLYNQNGTVIGNTPSGTNWSIWWDGDRTRELLDGTKLDKWNPANGGSNNRIFTIYNSGAADINGTKANPNLTADILGDWREEMIYRHYDNTKLIIYTTNHVTSHKMYTLMHDPQYRMAVAWQSTGYNQPPHPSFYIGEDMSAPPTPNIVLVGGTVNDCNGVANGTATIDDCGVCVGGNTGKTSCSGSIQFENACSMNGVTETVHAGYLGDSYVNIDNGTGSAITVTVNSETSQAVSLGFRFANGASANRDAQLMLNGAPVEGNISFASTGAWITWAVSAKQITLTSGVNVLELVAVGVDGLPNLDLISFTASGLTAGSCIADCHGDLGGFATVDNCNICSGGETGIEPNSTCVQDCNGDWDGTATVDACGTCSGGNTNVTACTGFIHGESACYYDGVIETLNTGFQGTGYVNTSNVAGASIWYNMSSSTAQASSLTVIYANGGTTDRPAQLLVNGQEQQASVSFPPTGSWATWSTVTIPVSFIGGNNRIELIAIGQDGCANIDQINLNSAAIQEAECIVTGTINSTHSSIAVYPNPFTSSIKVDVKGSFDYAVYNIAGVEVESGKAEYTAEIGANLEQGLYLIKIKEGGETRTFRVTKQN